MLRVALIGGTGMGDLLDGEFTEVATPFGSAFLIEQGDLYFLSRHGRGHKLPPHKINYRANIWALREVGVQAAIATFAVGSLRQSLPVGTLVVLDDFLTSRLHGRKLFRRQSAAYRHDPAVQPPGGKSFWQQERI